MTKTESGVEILPVDRRGRVRVSLQRREELLDAFAKSKLSGQKFAQLTGIKYSTFAAWANKRRHQQSALAPDLPSPGPSSAVEWLETVVTNAQKSTPSAAGLMLVRLPSGAAIELANAAQAPLAAAFLRAWEKMPC